MTPARPLTAIGLPTCNRPGPLARALEGLAALNAPAETDLVIVIVDNGTPSAQTTSIIDAFRQRSPWPVIAVHEPKRGIPYARNRLLDEAEKAGARYLIGHDDDEVAAPDWAAEMIAALSRGRHPMLGGPIRCMGPPNLSLSPEQAWYVEALDGYKIEDNAQRAREAAVDPDFDTVYTNNYGLDLATARRVGVRFDGSFAHSGGEDTDFARRLARAAGGLGWADAARVIEILPPERLTARYHLRRQRELAILMTRLRGWGRARSALACAQEIGDLAVPALPKLWGPPAQRVLYLFKLGRAAGYGLAAFGRESRAYAPSRTIEE